MKQSPVSSPRPGPSSSAAEMRLRDELDEVLERLERVEEHCASLEARQRRGCFAWLWGRPAAVADGGQF